MKLAVGVPITWTHVPTHFMTSYVRMFKPQQLESMRQRGIDKVFDIFNRNFPVDRNRNEICKSAIELDCDYLLFLDSDMTFPDDMVARLLDADRDIISGIYFKKAPPYNPVPSIFDPDCPSGQDLKPVQVDSPGLVKVDVVGAGCLLIRKKVLEKMKRPWFSYALDKRTGEMSISEDIGFCRKAVACGFEVWTDTRIVCGHISQKIIGFS
jgi:glycosyltransferase involved in cell wall biosynthesis